MLRRSFTLVIHEHADDTLSASLTIAHDGKSQHASGLAAMLNAQQLLRDRLAEIAEQPPTRETITEVAP